MDRTLSGEIVQPVVVTSNTGARPSSVSDIITTNNAAAISSISDTRPHPRLKAPGKTDALSVMSKLPAGMDSPARVYVIDKDTEQRLMYLTTQGSDNFRIVMETYKADEKKIFRKELKNNSGTLPLVKNLSRRYCEAEKFQDGKTGGKEGNTEYSLPRLTAEQLDQVGHIERAKPREGHSVPSFEVRQSDQTDGIGGETRKAEHSVPNLIAGPMNQGGKKGCKKKKANKKKANIAKKDTNVGSAGRQTQGNCRRVEEDSGILGIDVKARSSTNEYSHGSQRVAKDREETFEPVNADDRLTSNITETMLSMRADYSIVAERITGPDIEQAVGCESVNMSHLELSPFDNDIKQNHGGVQICELDSQPALRLGLKPARTAQCQEAIQNTRDSSVPDLAQPSLGQKTATVRSARALSSSSVVPQKGPFSNSSDQQPATRNNLDPPSVSSTTSTPFISKTDEKHHQRQRPHSSDDLERGHLYEMSSAGFSRGRTGRAYGRGILSDDRPVNTSEIPPFIVERPATSRRPHPGYQPPPKNSEQDNEASLPSSATDTVRPTTVVDSIQSNGRQTHGTNEASLKVPIFPNLKPQTSHHKSLSLANKEGQVKSTLTNTHPDPPPSTPKALTSDIELNSLVQHNKIDSYFLPVARAPQRLAANKNKTMNAAQDGHHQEISGPLREVAAPKPHTSAGKARDVTDVKDEITAPSRAPRGQPHAVGSTPKNVATSKYFGNTETPSYFLSKMEVIEITDQGRSSHGAGGGSNSTAHATLSSPGVTSHNLIGERNVRASIKSQDARMGVSSPDHDHTAANTVTNLDTTEDTGHATSNLEPSRRNVSETKPQLHIVNNNVPSTYVVGDWDASDSGWALKPWTKSILGPRIDYNILPRYNFGKPTKKEDIDVPAPTEDEDVEIEVEKNSEPVPSDYHESVHSADPPVTRNNVEDKALPPHLRTPAKTQGSLAPKGSENNKPTTKNADEQQLWVPPHLRTPKSAAPVTQSQSKTRSSTNGEPAEISNNPSKATMLKDITNMPHLSKATHNKPGNHTKADLSPHTDSPLSVISNVGTGASERSGTTPIPNKGKGKVIALEAPIAGWNGQMPPGPLKWNNEALYDNNDKRQRKHMQDWLARNVDQAVENPVQVDIEKPGFMTGHALADGQEELSGPVDPELHKTYLPDDPFTLSRAHQTSEDAAQKYQKILHDNVVETKKERRMWRRVAKETEANFIPPPNPHKPKANIYIRPVEDRDLAPITDIYNYYIQNSVVASERADLNIAQWRARWQNASNERYAFLVAVQMSGKGAGQNRRQANEVVVGFAYAEDHGDSNNTYRYTCEIQFWVHHAFPHEGVGKTLVDRMLFSLDPEYHIRAGTHFVGGEDEIKYKWGGERIIKQILIQMPYPADDDYNLKWQTRWLIGFDFWHVSTLPGIGYKFGKIVNVACFKKQTGSRIAAGA